VNDVSSVEEGDGALQLFEEPIRKKIGGEGGEGGGVDRSSQQKQEQPKLDGTKQKNQFNCGRFRCDRRKSKGAGKGTGWNKVGSQYPEGLKRS
jgi:hypothetical protein